MNEEIKNIKKKGPIRIEAVIPVTIIFFLSYVYFTYYFDRHMKNLFEYVGTQANGAEVNVASVKTSFLKGSFDLNGLQVTDAIKPSQNLISLQNIHFSYLWDALLRMKFVVEEASITSIQIYSPRKTPGFVLPPKPASPSKIEAIEAEVMGQLKDEFKKNVLGDLIDIIEGGDPKEQLEIIREELKSEKRVKEMISDVEAKKKVWDEKVKTLSDNSKIKEAEEQVQKITQQKNILEQAKGLKDLGDVLKDVQKQYKDIQKSSKELEGEIKSVTQYPKEIESLIKEDVASLKDRFKVPEIDFKDMAMTLFAKEFFGYIAQARKYQALAKEYIPEKKQEEPLIPPPRKVGKNYEFPILKGYPLFWLKKAAISSKGTKDTYSGEITGSLTNVTSHPKMIKIPLKLAFDGDFPGLNIRGVHGLITVDHTQAVAKQSADFSIKAFLIPEKLFVNSDKMKFGISNATGATQIKASLTNNEVDMRWESQILKPSYIVETHSKLAKEMLTNILNGIPTITINGSASGAFKNLNLNINSNLGDELGAGLKREVGAKVTEAKVKIEKMIDEKINGPKNQLMSQLGGNQNLIAQLKNVEGLYKNNEDKIKSEIEKFKKNGQSKALDGLKDKGKKLFKGLKL
jgi:uncharacterized protein (TIGR03545 family)